MGQKKRTYLTDAQVGSRPLAKIEKLPVCELTDNEIVKLFFRRFNADALVMAYIDSDGVRGIYGRTRSDPAYYDVHTRLSEILSGLDVPNDYTQFDQ